MTQIDTRLAEEAPDALDRSALWQALRAEEARRMQAEEELSARAAELDSFVYNVSHELKAPLVAIQGLAGIIVEDSAAHLDEDSRRLLERLQVNVHVVERLVQDLLDLSRAGRDSTPPGPVDLAEVVDEVAATMGARLRARGIELVRPDTAVLWGVRRRVEQVLSHLLDNAATYMGGQPSPRIEVSVIEAADLAQCSVKDNGIGIDPAHHQKIFEGFHRVREVDSDGTGIGLAICRRIVECAGGRLWVESESGHGAAFSFTWPLSTSGS
jgi:signal transduction histidine kinase